MCCTKFNFKREIIVFTLLMFFSAFLIYKVFPSSPYQGQSVIIFYASLINSAFYPAIFLFCVYLSLLSIADTIAGFIKKKNIPEQPKEEIENA